MSNVIQDIALKKLRPHNIDAEQYVLGACLKSKDVFARALEIIEESDFYKSGHRKIFQVLSLMIASAMKQKTSRELLKIT